MMPHDRRAAADGRPERQRGPGRGPVGAAAQAFARAARPRRAHRRRPRPLGVHAGRAAGRALRGLVARRRRRHRGRRPDAPRRAAPVRGRAGRDAGGLPGRGAARRGLRGGAHRRGAQSARSSRCPCSSTASWPPGPSTRERAWLRRGGWRGLAERIEAGELVPDFGPAARPPHGGRGARHGPAAADRLQRGPGQRRPGAGARDRGRDPRVGPAVFPACVRSACTSRSVVAPRCRPTCTTTASRRLRAVVEAVRARAEVAEAELVGLAPEAAFEGFPEDVPIRGFVPSGT